MEKVAKTRLVLFLLGILVHSASGLWELEVRQDDTQPLSKIALHRSTQKFDKSITISADPVLLGHKGETSEYVTVKYKKPTGAKETDWIGVFSPAKFNASECSEDLNPREYRPYICQAPIKYKYANYSSPNYVIDGEGSVTFRLVKQRSDFAFGFFSGDITNPVLEAISNTISFADTNAPVYPRLALGSTWDQMTVTWTSGYGKKDADAVVQWGTEVGKESWLSPASTLTFTRHDMCGPPARTVGWRDPGFFHTAYLKDLWPSTRYYYKVGHRMKNGGYVWGLKYYFTSSPALGEDTVQRVVIFGDMGKNERDGSIEYNQFQHGALNTTDQLVQDVENYDIVFHIGDLAYANGYMSQWDQFHEQVGEIAARVPYMVTNGNHERDYPGSGSFYQNMDSGGECGVPAQVMYHMPTSNKAKSWYEADWGMFHFCVADTEMDWREGTEQYKFLEQCFAKVDRQRQPWLIFLAHRVLGYSSGIYYAMEGTFAEPYGRESLQKLWQKYKVDLALYGHVHNYERSCPVYENQCVSTEKDHYSGTFNATIHIVAGGGGCDLEPFSPFAPSWSIVKDLDFGFTKLTAFNRTTLLFEYKKSRDGEVYDQFWISRNYRDVLGCDGTPAKNCPAFVLAT
ncbi:hypothetical protein M758_1G252900 [Ceratodon purpureus]|nr:hypothetical protein M758_1G252900 [Ceratodon purpureus]